MNAKTDSRATNTSRKMQVKKGYWDSKVPEIIELATLHGFKMKALANRYDCTVGAITSMLHERGVSIVAERYKYKKGLL